MPGPEVLGLITGTTGATLGTISAGRSGSLQHRVKAIEALLAEYGLGPPTGWTDQVDGKLAGLNVLAQSLVDAVGNLDKITAQNSADISTLKNDVAANVQALTALSNAMSQFDALLAGWAARLKEIGVELNAIADRFVLRTEDDRSDWEDWDYAPKLTGIGQDLKEIARKLQAF